MLFVWVCLFLLLSVPQFNQEQKKTESRNKAAQLCVQNKQTLKLFKLASDEGM